MPEQISVRPVNWSVGEGQSASPEGEVETVRIFAFEDPFTHRTYVFPFPKDEADYFAHIAGAEDIEQAEADVAEKREAEQARRERMEKLQVSGTPTEADLKRMSDAAQGKVPYPPQEPPHA